MNNQVSVSQLRDQISSCERKLQADWSACVSEGERVTWFMFAFRAFSALADMRCKTAKADDVLRRERVADAFSTHCIKHEKIWQKARDRVRANKDLMEASA
jgi:hypothetical protein